MKILSLLLCLFISNIVFSQDLHITVDSIKKEITLIKNYAEGYNPTYYDTSGQKVGVPPIPKLPAKVAQLLTKYSAEDSSMIDEYVLLIMIKLYREQYKCCKQGYLFSDITLSPLVNATMKIMNPCTKEDLEEFCWVDTYSVYKWVKERKEYLKYPPIKHEMTAINRLHVTNTKK